MRQRALTDVLRHSDFNDLSRTAVESKSNRSCNHRITEIVAMVRPAVQLHDYVQSYFIVGDGYVWQISGRIGSGRK